MINWENIRSQFLAFKEGTYLNTPATGLVPLRTIERMTQHYEALAKGGASATEQWVGEMEEVRRQLARLLHADDDYEVALVPNMATALNWLAPMLKPLGSVGFVEGDFPSLKSPFRIHGFRTEEAPAAPNGMIRYEDLRDLNTNILAISHVQWHTGFKSDLGELRKITKEKGQLLLVDATQSLGTCDINVREEDIDILVASGYKWLMSGFGNCVVYVKKELLEKYPSQHCWQYRAPADLGSFPDARRFEIGHERHDAFFRLGESLDLMLGIGIQNVEARVNHLRDYFYKKIHENGIELVSDYPKEYRSQIAILKGGDAEQHRLEEARVFVSNRGTGLRVGLHFYNNEEDVDRLAEVMVRTQEALRVG